MSIIDYIRHGGGPDPYAIACGLTATRTGWGRWEYSGLPAWTRSTRLAPDALDLAAMRAAGLEPTAAELAAAQAPEHRCPTCTTPTRRRLPLDSDQRCWPCWVADPERVVTDAPVDVPAAGVTV